MRLGELNNLGSRVDDYSFWENFRKVSVVGFFVIEFYYNNESIYNFGLNFKKNFL